MQKKSKKRFSISIAVIAISLLLLTTISRAETWNNHNLTIIYGEDVTSIDVSNHVDDNSGNHGIGCVDYTVNNCNTGSKTVTGYNSYNITVNSSAVGTQQITVETKKATNCGLADWGPISTTLNISCEYSTSLQAVVAKLGGIMDKYTYNTTNMFTTVTASNVEAIYEAKNMYDALTTKEKALVDSLINSKGTYTSYTALYDGAETYITNLATSFRNESLNTDTWNIEATVENYKTIEDAATTYNNLTVRVKTKVNTLLTIGTSSNTTYPSLLNDAKAIDFIHTNKIDTPVINLTKEIDETILNSETAWNNLLTEVKDIVNSWLKDNNDNGDDTYEEWMATVQNNLDQRNAEIFTSAFNLKDFEESNITEDIAKQIVNEAAKEYDKLNNNAQNKADAIIGIDFEDLKDHAQYYLDDLAAEKFVTENKLKDSMTEELANNILALDDDFNALKDEVQELVLDKIELNNFEELMKSAQDYLDDLAAEKFVTENKLKEAMTEQIANNILILDDDFNSLKDEVKELVLNKIGLNSFEELKEAAQDYLDNSNAMKFYKNYVEGLDSTKIVSGEESWNDANDKVKAIVNEYLNRVEIDETYPELLANAKLELNNKAADEFINAYLTLDDGTVISEVNNSNYKKVINAEEYYNLLSEEVKTLVNEKLQKVSNTTYPELLTSATNIVKTPKTGDSAFIVAIALVISVFGLIYIKRK